MENTELTVTKAEREALHVAWWLGKRGLEEAEPRSYGHGEHYVKVPVPPAWRNGRATVEVLARKVQPVKPLPYWGAMVEVSARLGLPKSFRTDLTVHDLNALIRVGHEVDRIGWMLGENFTHLVLLNASERLEHKKASTLADDERVHYFVGFEGRLHEVTQSEWVHAMTRSEDGLLRYAPLAS
jgi:hypothetical protein